MKKNKLMRIASVLLVATLLSTSVISGTFAKYVTTDQAQDAARVAKFGILTSAEGILFGDSYASADGKIQAANTPQTASVTAYNTTSGAMGNKLVAPGTLNDKGMTFSVNGTAEVSTKLTIDPAESEKSPFNDYENTDIYLRSGAYSLMVEIRTDNIVITGDNDYINTEHKYFYLDNGKFKPLELNSGRLPQVGGEEITVVYEEIPYTKADDFLTAEGANIQTDPDVDTVYYPVLWALHGTKDGVVQAPQFFRNCADVYTAIRDMLTADTTSGVKSPNDRWDNVANITWSWDFSDANGDVWGDLPNFTGFENTGSNDKKDTILGYMIAKALGDTGYEIAINENGTLLQVNYAKNPASDTAAQNVWVAATNMSEVTSWNDTDALACLEVNFGARITVEQVD